MSTQLNEAFASQILTKLWRSSLAKNVLMHLVKRNPKIDWNLVTDADIIQLTGKEAAKINDKNVWKFWTLDGNPQNVLMITNSNAVFDQWFDVNKRTRSASSIVGTSCLDANVLSGYSENGKAFLNSVRMCYIIDLTKLNANKAITGTQAARKDARAGATALMTDEQIKKQNLKRYAEAIKRNKVSDGSEFNLINSITKLFGDAMKKSSALDIVMKIMYDSFFGNYLKSYSLHLLECLQILNKVGFKIDANPAFLPDFSDDKYEYGKLAKNLTNAAERIKSAMNKNLMKPYEQQVIEWILKSDKKYEDYISACPDMNVKETLISFGENLRKIDSEATKAFQNPHISENLDNFDTFTMLVDQISDLQKSVYISDILASISVGVEQNDYDRLNYRIKSTIVGGMRRIVNVLVAIQKI